MRGNHVEAFIDGAAYFTAIDEELDALLTGSPAGKYFYLSAWWLGLVPLADPTKVRTVGDTAIKLAESLGALKEWQITRARPAWDLPKSGRRLLARLTALAQQGVDVRVLAWTSPFCAKYEAVAKQEMGLAALNAQTILSVQALRDAHLRLYDRVMLNLVAHPMGAAHLKLVICGDDTSMRAYTGGLDPADGRLTPPGQPAGWHDVAVRVQGPAALAIYRHYQQLWEEQRKSRPEIFHIAGKEIVSHTEDTARVPDRVQAAPPGKADHLVQVLRTVPAMRFSSTGSSLLNVNPVLRTVLLKATGFSRQPISFAPVGLFEFKTALRKAIAGAERYVFIADQAFSAQEVMGWLNERLLERPGLKVILLYGADPDDTPRGLFREAMVNHLLKGLPDDPVTGQPRGVVCYGWPGTSVHAKVAIVDDAWCAVGSANCMRRSLYTDVELSVGVIDATDPANGPSFAKLLRRGGAGRKS